jgi:hypothetical protein
LQPYQRDGSDPVHELIDLLRDNQTQEKFWKWKRFSPKYQNPFFELEFVYDSVRYAVTCPNTKSLYISNQIASQNESEFWFDAARAYNMVVVKYDTVEANAGKEFVAENEFPKSINPDE